MAGFTDEDIARVREASDIVAVVGERTPLRQRGRDFWCCCPIHNEKTPSCKIDPNLQLWHCFGCGEGGDVFAFVMKVDDLSFPEAVRKLAERAHIDIVETGGRNNSSTSEKARLKEICAKTAEFYHTQLMRSRSSGAESARKYLASRGFGGEVPKAWQLGYAPGKGELVRLLLGEGYKPDELVKANVALGGGSDGRLRDRFYERVMFPIRDVQGDPIAFGGRIMGEGQPKYLNSNETPLFRKSTVLYGLDLAKDAIVATGTAIVVEGYTDVIALHTAGMRNVVATLGTALTLQHIRMLSRYAKHRIVYLFDGDEAGQRAADRALGFIDEQMTPEAGRVQIELAAVTLPDGLDPADFVSQRGVDELKTLVGDAKPLIAYGIERKLARYDLSTPEGRSAAFADALSVLAPIKDTLIAQDYAVQIAGRTHFREDTAIERLRTLKAPSRPRAEEEEASTSHPKRAGEAQKTKGDSSVSESVLPSTAESAPITNQDSVSSGQSSRMRSEAELSRLRQERRLLCICAAYPDTALEHAGAIASLQWRDARHGAIASEILDYLSNHSSLDPQELLGSLMRKDPLAQKILTADIVSPEEQASFARITIASLQIEDLESTISALQTQALEAADEEEAKALQEAINALQMDLNYRRTHPVLN